MVARHTNLDKATADNSGSGLFMPKMTLVFPVLQYYPPFSDGTGTTINFQLMKHPMQTKRIWGVPRFKNWASGLMDCNGVDVPITRIEGSFEKAFWSIPLGWLGVYPYSVKFHYGVPRQLTLDQFRGKVTKLTISERGFGRNMKRLKEAVTYRDIILAQFASYKRNGPPLTLEIDVPDAADSPP
jgi:hypothetical protein